MNKQVLLVFDVHGWIWERRALGIQRYAPKGFKVDVLPQKDFNKAMFERYHAVLGMSYPDFIPITNRAWTFVANEGCMHEYNPNNPYYPGRTASRLKNINTSKRRLPGFRGVLTVNHRVVDFLKTLNPNVHYLTTGVDHNVFYPMERAPHDKTRIGWCGKPSDARKFSPKGYDEILVPLMQRVEGPVEWSINTRSSGDALNDDEMREWYNEIDVLLVTSCSEGTPNVILEAMACGTTFISTDVGMVGEVYNWDACSQMVPVWEREEHIKGTISELHKRINGFIESIENVRKLRHIPRTVIENHYSWERLSERWLRCLCEM